MKFNQDKSNVLFLIIMTSLIATSSLLYRRYHSFKETNRMQKVINLRNAIYEYDFRVSQIYGTCVNNRMDYNSFKKLYNQKVIAKMPSKKEYEIFIKDLCPNLSPPSLETFSGSFFYDLNIKNIKLYYKTFKEENYFNEIDPNYNK